MTKREFLRTRRHKARYQPRLELLEDRCVPAALLTVNSTLDTNARDTVLTLREAILVNNRALAVVSLTLDEQAQVSGTPTDMDTDTISFNLGAGTPLIAVPTALPTITDSVMIDGATGGATRVHLRGPGFSPFGTVANGLHITAGASTVNGLVLGGFLGATQVAAAIHLETAGGNTITGCFLGTDAAGANADMNRIGVLINNAPNNTIGGTAAGAGNLISGSNFDNVRITGDNATGNLIQGNFIGTNASGTAKIGSGADQGGGIEIIGADNNTIGGTAPGARNIISGAGGPGIELRAVTVNGVGATGNRIEGNYIGTDVTGTAKIGNSGGIDITDSPGNFIGGAAPGAGNVISGNGSSAIRILRVGSSGNVIQGNLIGTDATGTAPLSNGTLSDAISISEAGDTLIGGTVAGAGNVISGSANGIHISTGGSGTIIQGNFIGTDITGTLDLGNTQWGIINQGGTRTQVGGRTALARNVISGNDAEGIIWSPHRDSTGDVIEGNYIGVAADGMTALGNGRDPGRVGIAVESGTGTVIGGAADGAGNVISGNSGDGIRVNVNNGNVIQGNLIGVAADGTTALANGGHGVALWGGGNVVGGLEAGAANTIAFNHGNGVFVNFGTGNAILRNFIHSNTGLGIDIFPSGVTPNDSGDADTGFANNQQNFPEISAATFSGGMLTVTYLVPSSPTNSTYPLRIEFFKTDANGQEGQNFLGFDTYTAAEAGTTKTISFAPAAAVAAGDNIVGTATDNSGNSSEFTNQSAPVPPDGEPSEADLSITKGDSPDPVLVGQNVTYTVTVLNNGPDAATNVVLTDTLPAGVTFVSATGGAVPNVGVLTFSFGTISNGGSGSVTIIVRADQEGILTNQASVLADEQDPNENNNAAVQNTTVGAVNDAPSFTAGPNQIVQSGAGPQTVTGWATRISAGPPNEALQTLQFVISSDLPSLFAATPTVSSDGTLAYTPAPGARGVAIVSVQLLDDGGTENDGRDTSPTETFTITVLASGGQCVAPAWPAESASMGNVRAKMSKGTLSLIGDAASNALSIVAGSKPGYLRVSGVGSTAVNGRAAANELGPITRSIHVRLGGGDDYLVLDGSMGAMAVPGKLIVSESAGDGVLFDRFDIRRGSSGHDTVAVIDALLEGGLNVRLRAGNDMVALCGSTLHGEARVRTGRGPDTVLVDDSTVHDLTRVTTGRGDDSVGIDTAGDSAGPPTLFRRCVRVKTGRGSDTISLGSATGPGNSVHNLGCTKIRGGRGHDRLDAGLVSAPNANENDLAQPPVVRGIEQQMS